MLKAIIFAFTLVVVASAADSFYGSGNQLPTYRKIIKEQARQIDELLEINQQLMTRLKAYDTPRIASTDSDYTTPKKTVQPSRSSSSTDKYKADSRDTKDSREYSKDNRDYARDSRDYRTNKDSRDYTRVSTRDNRIAGVSGMNGMGGMSGMGGIGGMGAMGGMGGAGGFGIDPYLAEALFASAMMPMYPGRPSPQPQPIFNMYPQMLPPTRSPFSGPSFRPSTQRKEPTPKDLVPISLDPPMPEPISCNQVQEIEEEKTSQDQSGHEIKIKYESSTCSCEAERHCRYSYSSFNPETCVKQELSDPALSNCDLLNQCINDEQCDGILHDNGLVFKLTCSGDNTVSTLMADPHQFVIQIKNCL